MAKLTLAIDDLAVESFHTVSETPPRGTVVAAQSHVVYPECGPDTFYDPGCCSTHETACEGATCVVLSRCCPSQDPTCPFSCQPTCTCGPSAYCVHTDVC